MERGMQDVQLDEMELVSAKEAYTLMKIGKTHFYDLAKCDGFPEKIPLGGSVRWVKKELVQWLYKRRGQQ
jgi:predicted DNA-binding transcriptional regulator AlpA